MLQSILKRHEAKCSEYRASKLRTVLQELACFHPASGIPTTCCRHWCSSRSHCSVSLIQTTPLAIQQRIMELFGSTTDSFCLQECNNLPWTVCCVLPD